METKVEVEPEPAPVPMMVKIAKPKVKEYDEQVSTELLNILRDYLLTTPIRSGHSVTMETVFFVSESFHDNEICKWSAVQFQRCIGNILYVYSNPWPLA